jgi:UDP-3-O-[3-hydroxymyristoyl] glucosamine N-acyltransferase
LNNVTIVAKLSEIGQLLEQNDLFIERLGNDITLDAISPAERPITGTLVCIDSPENVTCVAEAAPGAVITNESLKSEFSGLSTIVSSNVKLSHAIVRAAFFDYDLRASEWGVLHPSAVVHDSVGVPSNVMIGPGVIVGRDVQLGENCALLANAVIEHDVVIGDDTVVHAGVFIGHGCQIGKRVILKPGCVIGAEGFGFVQDDNKKSHRIPQRGNVVIEDNVVVGANCTIDRATYSETRISAGCKLDALCHIGHNVFLDEDCIIVAQTGIAGSTRFGKRVIATGQTGTLDHKTVTDDVILVHRCGVTEDITEPGVYATTPPQPFRDYRRNIATYRKLYELRQRLQNLEKKIAKLSGQ